MNLSLVNTIVSALSSEVALIIAIGIGTLLAVFGALKPFTEKSIAARRMEPRRRGVSVTSISVESDSPAPGGLAAALIPQNEDERRQVANALARAGFLGHNAVAKYYIIRLGFGLGLPLLLCGGLLFARTPHAPEVLASYLGGLSAPQIAQHIAVLTGIGFFAPAYWLKSRIAKRKLAIEEAFPNMLDLLQVGVEAGMGFDQALLKVAIEIQSAAPELAEEMIVLLSEIQAGRDRDRALMRMARRTAIDEMTSFVNVVMQSSRFGTSMSDALTVYAEEMRVAREMKAQEKANKLPVQMSAVLAALMLPSLIALVLAPIVIRYMSAFG
ncbi:type II secretion system F family protein [Sulfitobacter sabulilitoris]|uniref:Type II secretion system F family protein n=1 Tax=Sulfitobacter sabulilitoris TaxID=2562655 RepID=A0A5S3PK13_9RHOB|nr:type II secretion system F family protein [Sulfitobacter sabulilitoris]TMM54758.1 type II secretion system F family protein [Sulfitobacter sabulilitoris]